MKCLKLLDKTGAFHLQILPDVELCVMKRLHFLPELISQYLTNSQDLRNQIPLSDKLQTLEELRQELSTNSTLQLSTGYLLIPGPCTGRFVPERKCQAFNRLLDRRVDVPGVEGYVLRAGG